MQQVCGAVVAHSIFAPLHNHIGLYAITYTHVSFANASIVDNQPLERTTCILNLEDTHRAAQVTTITYLTTTFCIEWCGVEYHQGILWSADAINLNTIYNQANDLATSGDPLVTG